MPEAVLDLATGLQQAIIGLDEARSACLKYGFLDTQSRLTIRNPAGAIPSEIEDALARSRDLIGHVRARSARISLLFGPVSAPDRATTLAIIGLEDTQFALEERPGPDYERCIVELASARKYLSEFNEWALRDAKGRPWYAAPHRTRALRGRSPSRHARIPCRARCCARRARTGCGCSGRRARVRPPSGRFRVFCDRTVTRA